MDYDPLFEPGFHEIAFERIGEIFVDPFSNSNIRKLLFNRLKAFLKELKKTGISFEIWIDGSFATNKPEPADIDIVVVADPNKVNQLPRDKVLIINKLLRNKAVTRLRYKCDVYFVLNDNPNALSYWRRWFGFSPGERPKGIPRLTI